MSSCCSFKVQFLVAKMLCKQIELQGNPSRLQPKADPKGAKYPDTSCLKKPPNYWSPFSNLQELHDIASTHFSALKHIETFLFLVSHSHFNHFVSPNECQLFFPRKDIWPKKKHLKSAEFIIGLEKVGYLRLDGILILAFFVAAFLFLKGA